MRVIKVYSTEDPTVLVTLKSNSKFVYPTAPTGWEGSVFIRWYPCMVYDREAAESWWDCAGLTSEGTVIFHGMEENEESAVHCSYNIIDRISFQRYRDMTIFNPIKLDRPNDVGMSIKLCVL